VHRIAHTEEMIRSSYIDWLMDQSHRSDEIGDASRWLIRHMRSGFEPIDMFDLLDKAASETNLEGLDISIKRGLVEFATGLESYTEISEEQTLESKLEAALREEDYKKAARLRDEMDILQKEIKNNNNK